MTKKPATKNATTTMMMYAGVALSLMLTAMLFVSPLGMAGSSSLVRPALADGSSSSGNRVQFDLTDEPGRWFRNTAGDITASGTESLAVGNPGVRVDFNVRSNTVHTVTSLIFPAGAANMPFDQAEPSKSSQSVTLQDPGLYVFTCKVHPYMFGAVIVDDPATAGLDLGEQVSLVNGITVPTSSDLATRLLRTFFIATAPANWQDYTSPSPWHVTYPNVDVRITGGVVVNLPAVLNARYGNDVTLPPLSNPATPGVGQVWVDTQFEKTTGKTKPGTATAVDAQTWQVARKVALPQINMNNPHNMWTDRNQNLIYQTQWFDSKLTVFERATGKLVKNVSVGESPSHVMTRTDTDQVHVALNGEDVVVEMAPGGQSIQREIPMQRPGEPSSHPHAHWMSHDGKKMVTPNAFSADSTLYGFDTSSIEAKPATGALPIATGMMPDSSKYYVANLLDSTISVVSMQGATKDQVIKTINLLQNYDPISGALTGPVGALPIQTPVSPNGRYMVTANTLTATITVTDTVTDTVVKMLPCDAGCHGVNFGAKQGGGYYAYVASKFSNAVIVVDGDPNGDGNPADAAIVGRVALVASASTAKDASVTANRGMGGQGVLAIPNVYNGWVQNLPQTWKAQLTAGQQNPVP
ncbi:beta-propeller fold lactonase family protein [Nitrososphaera sp.]|uniref:beta-propeller fold lactonase family protein n=1 Tax=Nitrososphaera sp. TaxID=1971748 RepID=UPI00307D50D8